MAPAGWRRPPDGARGGSDRGLPKPLDHLDAELGVEELIGKLPDVLFPFDGDEEGEELTPFTAVYGSPEGGAAGYESRPPRHRREGGGGLSPGAADFVPFGSAPAASHRRAHGFGGRGLEPAAAGATGGWRRRSPTSSPSRVRVAAGVVRDGGGPSERRQVHAPQPASEPGEPRAVRTPEPAAAGAHPAPVKKNPAPGFNGAGFRSARGFTSGRCTVFVRARGVCAPWARVSGIKDSVHALGCIGVLTIPASGLQFFRDHAVAFELSPCARYDAAKMPGEEHARIPPPPAEGKPPASPRPRSRWSGNVSLAS